MDGNTLLLDMLIFIFSVEQFLRRKNIMTSNNILTFKLVYTLTV